MYPETPPIVASYNGNGRLSLKINGLAPTVPVARQLWGGLVGYGAVGGAVIDRSSASDQIIENRRSAAPEMGIGSRHASILM